MEGLLSTGSTPLSLYKYNAINVFFFTFLFNTFSGYFILEHVLINTNIKYLLAKNWLKKNCLYMQPLTNFWIYIVWVHNPRINFLQFFSSLFILILCFFSQLHWAMQGTCWVIYCDWVDLSKITRMEGLLQDLAGLVRGISPGRRLKGILRSTPACPSFFSSANDSWDGKFVYLCYWGDLLTSILPKKITLWVNMTLETHHFGKTLLLWYM